MENEKIKKKSRFRGGGSKGQGKKKKIASKTRYIALKSQIFGLLTRPVCRIYKRRRKEINLKDLGGGDNLNAPYIPLGLDVKKRTYSNNYK